METGLCTAALEMALSSGRKPRVFNTDQGSQYTSGEWTRAVEGRGIAVSVDGKGRWADNIVMERFWRTYKYDFFHLRECRSLEEARSLTAVWLDYYNRHRPHENLGYEPPSDYSQRRGYPPAATSNVRSCYRTSCPPAGSKNSFFLSDKGRQRTHTESARAGQGKTAIYPASLRAGIWSCYRRSHLL